MSKRLETLKKQREALDARIRKAESQERTRERKRDTRKKIVVGGYFLDKMKRDPALDAQVLADLEKKLTRNVDRELFGFAPLGEGESKSSTGEEGATQPRRRR